MSRSMTTDMLNALQERILRMTFFYEGNFKDGALRLWNGIGDVAWDGHTWTGAGHLIKINNVEETSDIRAAGVSLSLGGVNPAMVSLCLLQARRNLIGRIWIGLTAADNSIISDPTVLFQGRLDTMAVQDGAKTATIIVGYEHELITLEKARESRYTDKEQKRLYPGDRGLEFISKLQDATIPWGAR